MIEAEGRQQGVGRYCVPHIEDGGRHASQGVWVTSRSWKRRGNRPYPPQSLHKEHSPDNTLIWVQGDPYQTSDFQNYMRINLCPFKPVNLW